MLFLRAEFNFHMSKTVKKQNLSNILFSDQIKQTFFAIKHVLKKDNFCFVYRINGYI